MGIKFLIEVNYRAKGNNYKINIYFKIRPTL